jgi:hypothetical protein
MFEKKSTGLFDRGACGRQQVAPLQKNTGCLFDTGTR